MADSFYRRRPWKIVPAATGSCEQDKGNDAPQAPSMYPEEFNAYNDGWNYIPPKTYVGAISCRNGSGAGHQTFGGYAGSDQGFNCSHGSSNPWCSTGYGCNEKQDIATCCVDNPKCGDNVVDPQLESCDDGNNNNGDGCDNDCKVSYPGC